MKTIFASFDLRNARHGRRQIDAGGGHTERRNLYINVRSIWWYPEIDQPQPTSNTNSEQTVLAWFVPEETTNYIGKAFLESWCKKNGRFRPEIGCVWLQFNLDGQTQRFESCHQIIDIEVSVQFFSNRSPVDSGKRSLLEDHIREYFISLPKRQGSAHSKEVAVRSRTWPLSLTRWPRISGNLYAKKKQKREKPIIQLNEKDSGYARSRPIDVGEVAENRGQTLESLAQHIPGNILRRNISAIQATSIDLLSGGVSSHKDPAELECTASSDDPCTEQISGNHNLVAPVSPVVVDAEIFRKPVLNRSDQTSDIRLNSDVRYASSCQVAPTTQLDRDEPSLDNRQQTPEFAAVSHDSELPSASALQENTEPLVAVGTSKDGSTTQIPSIPHEVLVVEESQPWTQPMAGFQQEIQPGRVYAFSHDTDYSKRDLTMGNPNSVESTTFADNLGCHSIIKDIYQADRSLIEELAQQEEPEIGNVRGLQHGSMAQEVSSSPTIGLPKPDLSSEQPDRLNRVSVRQDENPNSANSFCPASTSNAAISPVQDIEKLNVPETQYTDAALDTNSKEVADFDNEKQAPDGSDEIDTWDLCHEFDHISLQSPDNAGLPFTDDYWTYDEKTKNYYHVEVEDDGTQSVSWYPLEFD